jgi:hypothetical protein
MRGPCRWRSKQARGMCRLRVHRARTVCEEWQHRCGSRGLSLAHSPYAGSKPVTRVRSPQFRMICACECIFVPLVALRGAYSLFTLFSYLSVVACGCTGCLYRACRGMNVNSERTWHAIGRAFRCPGGRPEIEYTLVMRNRPGRRCLTRRIPWRRSSWRPRGSDPRLKRFSQLVRVIDLRSMGGEGSLALLGGDTASAEGSLALLGGDTASAEGSPDRPYASTSIDRRSR